MYQLNLSSEAPARELTLESIVVLVLHFVFTAGFWIGIVTLALRLSDSPLTLTSRVLSFIGGFVALALLAGAGHYATARYLDRGDPEGDASDEPISKSL